MIMPITTTTRLLGNIDLGLLRLGLRRGGELSPRGGALLRLGGLDLGRLLLLSSTLHDLLSAGLLRLDGDIRKTELDVPRSAAQLPTSTGTTLLILLGGNSFGILQELGALILPALLVVDGSLDKHGFLLLGEGRPTRADSLCDLGDLDLIELGIGLQLGVGLLVEEHVGRLGALGRSANILLEGRDRLGDGSGGGNRAVERHLLGKTEGDATKRISGGKFVNGKFVIMYVFL